MTTQAFEVTVVGAGLVGACCALALGRAGLRVALVDAERSVERSVERPSDPALASASGAPREHDASALEWDARIYAISPASVALLERLDVWQRVPRERIAGCTRMRVFGDDPRARLEFTAYEVGVPALATMMESRTLARALDQALAATQGVTRIDGARVVALDRDGDGIQARLDSDKLLRSALIVGADGVNSQVRVLAGLAVTRDDYGELGVVANFATIEPHRGCAYQWFRSDGVLALLPLPGRRVSMVWSTPRAHAESLLALSGEALAREVEQASDHALGALATITGARGFPLARQSASRMAADRVALVGDAAHVVHPLAGQGLNLGFGDVAALVETLCAREPYRALDDERLLRRYERARAEPVAAMRTMTHGLHWLYGLPGGMPKRLRTFGLNLTNRLPVVRSMLARHAIG